jgi:hypothetical protein
VLLKKKVSKKYAKSVPISGPFACNFDIEKAPRSRRGVKCTDLLGKFTKSCFNGDFGSGCSWILAIQDLFSTKTGLHQGRPVIFKKQSIRPFPAKKCGFPKKYLLSKQKVSVVFQA